MRDRRRVTASGCFLGDGRGVTPGDAQAGRRGHLGAAGDGGTCGGGNGALVRMDFLRRPKLELWTVQQRRSCLTHGRTGQRPSRRLAQSALGSVPQPGYTSTWGLATSGDPVGAARVSLNTPWPCGGPWSQSPSSPGGLRWAQAASGPQSPAETRGGAAGSSLAKPHWTLPHAPSSPYEGPEGPEPEPVGRAHLTRLPASVSLRCLDTARAEEARRAGPEGEQRPGGWPVPGHQFAPSFGCPLFGELSPHSVMGTRRRFRACRAPRGQRVLAVPAPWTEGRCPCCLSRTGRFGAGHAPWGGASGATRGLGLEMLAGGTAG